MICFFRGLSLRTEKYKRYINILLLFIIIIIIIIGELAKLHDQLIN